MFELRIEKVLSINQYTLVVYYSSRRCYQFSLIDESGQAVDFKNIFYTADAAERFGKAAIKTVSEPS